MKNKFRLYLIFAAVLLLLGGCKLKEKIGKNITEGLVEGALGDEADIDIEDGEISFSGKDGEEVTIDEEGGVTFEGEDGAYMVTGDVYDWPEGMAADYIPKFDKGKITYIYNTTDGLLLYIEETELEDYEDYKSEVIDEGYTVDKFESAADDLQFYTAKSDEGVVVTVSYVKSEKYLQITVDASSKQE